MSGSVQAKGRQVWATVEDSILLIGPPRSGKGLHVVINAILDAPGARPWLALRDAVGFKTRASEKGKPPPQSKASSTRRPSTDGTLYLLATGAHSSQRSIRRVPILPPNALRTLPFGTGVVMLRTARPIDPYN